MTTRPGRETNHEDGGLGDAAKWLAGSIPVGVAALTFAGLSGDQLSRVVRVFPVAFVIGIVALVVAVVAGVVALMNRTRARAWLATGVGLFGLGVAVLVTSHAVASSTQDRPTVTAGLTRGPQGLVADVSVGADGLKPQQYVYVAVQGFSSEHHLDPNAARLDDIQTAIPDGEYSKQRIYSGRIGASASGHVASSFDLPLSSGLYEQYVVQAAILTVSSDSEHEENEILTGDEETGAFKCNATTPNISCITVLLPAQSQTQPRTPAALLRLKHRH